MPLFRIALVGCILAITIAAKCKLHPDVVDGDPNNCPSEEEIAKSEAAGKFEGDMVTDDKGEGADRNALIDRNRLWKKGSDGKVYVPYDDSGVDAAVKKVVQSAAASYAKNTCIRLRRKQSGDRDYIRLIMQPWACYSQVGRRGGVQDLSLGDGCKYHGTAVHEFMHAMGFLHEQSRPDRDNYIRIHKENIQDSMAYNFDKANANEYYNIMEYDYGSIMHYPSTAFTKNGKATLSAVKSGAQFGQRQGFSKFDIAKLNKQYKCDESAIGGDDGGEETGGGGGGGGGGGCMDNSPSSDCEAWKQSSPEICQSGHYIGRDYCKKTCGLC